MGLKSLVSSKRASASKCLQFVDFMHAAELLSIFEVATFAQEYTTLTTYIAILTR